MSRSITIFIPAYNEEDCIESVIYEARDTIEQLTKKPEIIVVNDGSNDRTGQILEDLKEKIGYLRVIHQPYNKGIAAAMKTGYAEAKGDIIFFNSADGQAPMSHLEKMLPYMEDADLIVGYFPKRHDKKLRIIFSRIYHSFIRILFGIKLHNINALKTFKRQIIANYMELGDNLCIDAELIIRAKMNGCEIKEVALEHYPRAAGKTKIISMRNSIQTFFNIFILYLKIKREKMRNKK